MAPLQVMSTVSAVLAESREQMAWLGPGAVADMRLYDMIAADDA